MSRAPCLLPSLWPPPLLSLARNLLAFLLLSPDGWGGGGGDSVRSLVLPCYRRLLKWVEEGKHQSLDHGDALADVLSKCAAER